MNKMKKLLSVLLAVLMILSSMTVMASAATTAYKTVNDLTALNAYSPYGQVTRLSTEERASIIQDALDGILEQANINMGTLIDMAGITVTVDLRSIDALCGTVDSVQSALSNGLVGLAGAFVDLGILEDINLDSWQSGMKRANVSQLLLFSELFEVLGANKTVIANILREGSINLGIISLGDMSAIEDMLGDLPGMIKGMLFPMLERWDDTKAEIQALETAKKGNGNVENTLNNFVKNLFKNDMSITTVKADANGNTTSEHSLPGAGADARVRYVKSGNILTAQTYATQTYVDAQAKLGVTVAEGSYYPTAMYILEKESGTDDYVWAKLELEEDKDGNLNIKYDDAGEAVRVGENLKYYNLNSPLLPSLTTEIDLSTMSVADLLYTFIPPVFNDMAPVVLNGSLKKILGGLFGAKYTYVGQVGDDAVNALPDASNAFFTQEQGEYLWEWSDYAVINGNHYYRFEDQIFSCDVSNTNPYFNVINWNYKITGDFMNEFVPANGGSTSDTLLMNLNDFLIKVAEEVLADSFLADGTLTKGDNSNLVANIKKVAQDFIKYDPASIFGSDYETNDRCYYNLLISNDNDTVLTGIAAQLVDLIMPSMYLPGAEDLVASKAKVGAILAAVIREFAAYLVPEYNYDALIYADFGTTTNDPDKTFVDPEAAGLLTSGQTASGYWLDVIMTMALDVGYEYMRAFADMGEDTAQWAGVTSVGYGVDGKTYAAGTTQATLNAQWEGMLDYVIDWALEKDYEWTWKMENLVDITGLTIDLATAQDPWVKLDKILYDLLPIDEVLNITPTDCETRVEQALRYNLILAIVDLKWEKLSNSLIVPDGFARTDNVLDSLATVLKNLINGLFAKVGGGSYAFLPAGMTDLDTLANQANLATLVENLLGALTLAYNNGLLDTIFPFLNMLLGWKTTPQAIADPVVWTTFRDGNDYAFQWTGQTGYPAIDGESTQIHFYNGSSGMLETHRGSSVVDKEYAIQIKSITSDATVNTITFDYGDGYASPYETIDIKIGGTYNGEEAITVTIAYEYTGKDGVAVGGLQYTSLSFLVSNQFEDNNVTQPEEQIYSALTASQYRNAYNKYIFSEDIYTTINEAQVTFNYKNSISGTKDRSSYEAPDLSIQIDNTPNDTCDDDYTWLPEDYPTYDQYAKTYFTYRTVDESGWPASMSSNIVSGTATSAGKFYKGIDTYGPDYDYPIGIYAFQPVAVAYSEGEAIYQQVFIHYDDYDIYELYTANKDNGYNAYQGVDAATYKAYNDAWKEVVRLATYPLMTKLNGNAATDYIDVIMPQIQPAMEAFEAAKEAYEEALAEAQASGSATASLPAYVQDLEKELALDAWAINSDLEKSEKEINFQDYEFYEYFNYADTRTAGRNLVSSYYAPEVMDTYYILNSGIREAELNNVIAAEDNAAIAAGITASRMENDAQAIADSIAARDAFQQPINSKLYVDDLTARIAYYKTFLTGMEENADHLYFLNQEIAHVEAQQFVEGDYTADSWARYAEALAEAKAVAAGNDDYATLNSRIYDVKYNLMVARKNLLLKANSLIEAGGTADLMVNAAIADEIFASLGAADGAWVVKEGVDADSAYAQLITALGYYYTGEDGNEWNLYADSALEYIDNDRPNNKNNQAKVNAANTALEAAIANFESTASAEPNTIMLKEDAPFEAIIDTVNCGDYNGAIYGFDTLGWNDEFIIDGTIADFVTTAYGDEYLEVVVGDAGVETTGTLINVLDEDGNVLETYVYIYFGDVDMDGLVGASDAYACEYYEMMYEGFDTLYQFMAGDLDGDTMPGSSDAYVMEYYEMMYEGMPSQADVGAVAKDIEYIIY